MKAQTPPPLAERFRTLRQALGHTQAEIAAATGIPLPTWKKYESGDREPGAAALAALASTGVSLHWLLTGDGELWRDREAAPDVAAILALLAPKGKGRAAGYGSGRASVLNTAEPGILEERVDAELLAATLNGVENAERLGSGRIDAVSKAALVVALYLQARHRKGGEQAE